MNRAYFFKRVRESLFAGKLSQTQAEGIGKILDYRDREWPRMPDDELAYLLATVKWETAHRMQPITEMGSRTYLMNKPYWPWIGRGLVQITWKRNYDKFGVQKPDDALKWDVSLDIAFRGMIHGMFTGKKLADYFGEGKRDWVGARRIINGTDKAKQIAMIAEGFYEALTQAKEPHQATPVQEDEPQTTGKPMAQSTTLWAQITQWLGAGGAAVLTALGSIDWKTALVVGGLVMVGAGIWIIRERWIKSKVEGV